MASLLTTGSLGRLLSLCTIVTLLAPLSGCSSSSDPDPEQATEIPLSKKPAVEGASEELFQNAKRLYSSALFSVARDTFDSLRIQQPLGAYAEFAAIKAADCSFESGAYDEAAIAYEELIKNHPASRSADYILLQTGRSYLLANRGVGRDASPLEKGRTYLEQLIQEYPESRYYSAALELRQTVVELLAQQERQVMDFYAKKEMEGAYLARAQVYQQKWAPLLSASRSQLAQANPARPQLLAAEGSTRSALSPPIPKVLSAERAQTIASATEDSPRMMAKLKNSVLESGSGTRVLIPAQNQKATHAAGDSLARYLAQARCSQEMLFIETSSSLQPEEYAALSKALESLQKSKAAPTSTLSLSLPLHAAAASELRCFDGAQVSISTSGSLAILGAPKLKLLLLEKPSRMLFMRDS